MSIICSLVQELLPAYKNGVVNKSTKEIIDNHLMTCEECKRSVKGSDIKLSSNIKILKKYSKILKTLKILVSVCIIIIVVMCVFGWKVLHDQFPDKSSGSENYGKWEEFKGYSGLKVFPEKCNENAVYNYYYSNDINPVGQIYLECVYDESEFIEEIQRLEGIQILYKDKINEIQKDTENFITDAYVLEYNWRGCYEYALVFEDIKAIVYVYLQNIDYDNVDFTKLFLPVNYGKEQEQICQYAFGYNDNLESCVLVFE